MTYLVGVDGGGTKTEAVVGKQDDFGRVEEIGCGLSGPSNLRTNGIEATFASIKTAIESAIQNSDLPSDSTLSTIVVALAGSSDPNLSQQLTSKLEKEFSSSKILTTTDLHTVLAAANNEESSLVSIGVICGTGSIAFSEPSKGNLLRSGGWGFVLDDPGSGYWIGKQTLKLFFESIVNSDSESQRNKQLLKFLGLKSHQEVVDWLYQQKETSIPAKVASLSKFAFQNQDEFPELSQIISDAALEIANMIRCVKDQVSMYHNTAYHLVMSGSILTKQKEFRKQVTDRLKDSDQPEKISIVDRPVLGALEIAKNVDLG